LAAFLFRMMWVGTFRQPGGIGGWAAIFVAAWLLAAQPDGTHGYGCEFSSLYDKTPKRGTSNRELDTDVDTLVLYSPDDGMPVFADISNGKLLMSFCKDVG